MTERVLAPEVAKRQKIEKAIVRRVIRDALKAGYKLNISNGGDGYELPEPTDKYKVANEAMFATDEEHLYFFKEGKRIGWVFFVYGNSGWDVMCDNVDNPEVNEILKGGEEVAARYDK